MTFFENQANLKMLLALILVISVSLLVYYGSISRSRTKSPLPRTRFPWVSVIIATLLTILICYLVIRVEETMEKYNTIIPTISFLLKSHECILTTSRELTESNNAMMKVLIKENSMGISDMFSDILSWIAIIMTLILLSVVMFRTYV